MAGIARAFSDSDARAAVAVAVVRGRRGRGVTPRARRIVAVAVDDPIPAMRCDAIRIDGHRWASMGIAMRAKIFS